MMGISTIIGAELDQQLTLDVVTSMRWQEKQASMMDIAIIMKRALLVQFQNNF
jgi:hypothetical protein